MIYYQSVRSGGLRDIKRWSLRTGVDIVFHKLHLLSLLFALLRSFIILLGENVRVSCVKRTRWFDEETSYWIE
jgi:hypothetical protein